MDFGPGAQGGFQNALAMGMQFGQLARQAQDRKEYKNALAQYDPSNPETLKPIIAANPEVGLQLRGQVEQQEAARLKAEQGAAERRLKQLPQVVGLLEQVTDDQGFQRVRQIAGQQFGFDLSGVPENFSPQWMAENLPILKSLTTPEGREALSTAGKIAADFGYTPGTPEFAAEAKRIFIAERDKTITASPGGTILRNNPYTRETEVLAGPTAGAGGAADIPIAVNDETGEVMEFRGGRWVPQGGAGGNVSGNFPGL